MEESKQHAPFGTRPYHVTADDEACEVTRALNALADVFYREHRVSDPHIASNNKMLADYVCEIVDDENAAVFVRDGVSHVIYLENVRVGIGGHFDKKRNAWISMTLEEAYRRNLTYQVPLFADGAYVCVPGEPEDSFSASELKRLQRSQRRDRFWQVRSNGGWRHLVATDQVQVVHRTKFRRAIGQLPLMVGTLPCRMWHRLHGVEGEMFDTGAYYCIGGNRRVIPPLKKLNWNREMVWPLHKDNELAMLEIRATHENRHHYSTSTVHIVMHGYRHKIAQHGCGYDLMVTLPFLKKKVHVMVLLLALGFDGSKVLRMMCLQSQASWNPEMERLVNGFIHSSPVATEREALLNIYAAAMKAEPDPEQDRIGYSQYTLRTRLFPQIDGDDEEDRKTAKALYLLFCIWRILMAATGQQWVPNPDSEEREPYFDDRDAYPLRRLETSGTLIASLFRKTFGFLGKQVANNIKRAYRAHDDVSSAAPAPAPEKAPAPEPMEIDEGNGAPEPQDAKDEEEEEEAKQKIRFQGLELDMNEMLNETKLGSRATFCVGNGAWGIKSRNRGAQPRQNVSQHMQNLNPLAEISDLTRINNSTNPDQKSVWPRQVRADQWGRQCPNHTPDGKTCGQIGHVAFGVRITTGSCPHVLADVLRLFAQEVGLLPHSAWDYDYQSLVAVMVNGKPIGWTKDAPRFEAVLREMKRTFVVDPYLSVYYDRKHRVVRLNTGRDRNVRPLVYLPAMDTLVALVNDPDFGPTGEGSLWNLDLLWRKGIIVYCDAEEEQSMLVAFNQRDRETRLPPRDSQQLQPPLDYDYIEVDCAFIWSVAAALTAFPTRNESPRNTYQAGMSKQAVSFAPPGNHLMHASHHALCYPQRSLVPTKMHGYLEEILQFSYQTPMVAVTTFEGIGREDSVIVKKEFVERGGFLSEYYKLYKAKQYKHGSSTNRQLFHKPDPDETEGMKMANYEKLQPNGVPPVGTVIEDGDVVIGQTSYIRPLTFSAPRDAKGAVHQDAARKRRCISVVHKGPPGVVDRVVVTTNSQGQQVRKVYVSSTRFATVGDKLSACHAQKGTIAAIVPSIDLPTDPRTGMSPDLIINPHGFPSRKTVGMLAEMLAGKSRASRAAGTAADRVVDGHPFRDSRSSDVVDACGAVLRTAGLEPTGKQRLMCGKTGRMQDVLTFMAPCAYIRLKHMPVDKLHARAQGPVVAITRQPKEGRANDGGMRMGEMERDVLAAHGASEILGNQFRENSDHSKMFVCERCRVPAIGREGKSRLKCLRCGRRDTVVCVDSVHAWNLTCHELAAMGIFIKHHTERVAPETNMRG